MSDAHTLMLSLTIYKVFTIFAGLAFAFMGYRLFIHGIFREAGELQTNWENRNLILKKAAPGTFFALFGTIIVCVSLWRGLNLEPSQERGYIGGSGLFSTEASREKDRILENPHVETTRQTTLNDIATLNHFAEGLLQQRQQTDGSRLTVIVEDGNKLLDLVDRTKETLMLSVWSQDWGDREEFRKWAQGGPGYFYSDPPTGIARAAAIFKGEAK